MRGILIISDESRHLLPLFKKIQLPFDKRNAKQSAKTFGTDIMNPLQYDIAFLDLDYQGWRQKIIELRHILPVITFSTPNIKNAVESIKLGASDYLEKPLSKHTLEDIIGRYKKSVLSHAYGFDESMGTSESMQAVYGLIKKAAASESNVLITGESGTGKELIARAIHTWSPRKENEFVVINCSAIPDTLLESELFGFEKGAFTGANYTKKGLLEIADRGTGFFDEIGDVSPLFQTKILRVIQDRNIMRIGSTKYNKVDLRIISATNRDLLFACKKGIFREDLFYRLNVINIHLPPLRNRIEDIPLLVAHFLRKHAHKRKDRVVDGISNDAMNVLMHYAYPGNVRELENIIEHAISFTNSRFILPSNLPSHLIQTPSQKINPSPHLKETLYNVEKELIWNALQKSGGNISRAAESLGIHRQQLQRKLKRLQ